jgi:hypothetical protein
MVLAGQRAPAIAEAVNVHPNSVREWLRTDTQLRTMLTERRDALLQESMDNARQALGTAIERLVRILESPTSNDQVAVSAARTLLEYSLKAHHFNQLEQELLELKAQLEE